MKLVGLKNIRKIYGLTMRDLAKKMSVTANAVNLWESGAVDVPEYRLTDLSKLLGLDKQLFLKDNHDAKDLMLIEIARAEYKIEEYKFLIKDDSESIDSIIDETRKMMTKKISNVMFRAKEGEYQYDALKSLLSKIVEAYSKIPFDEYEEFDDLIRYIIGDIVDEPDKWKKFAIMYYSLEESEKMYGLGNDYGISCNVKDLMEKQIRDNVEQLYKKKLYDEGKYKPY